MPVTSAENSDLSQIDVLASSIPHFLHWDLAYLWMLDRSPELVPPSWKERLLLWRRLLHAFLAGQLRVREHPISPFLEPYARQFGIEKLQLLDHGGRVVGLLSPVVLLRPLPDGEPELPEVKPKDYPGLLSALELTLEEIRKTREATSGSTQSKTDLNGNSSPTTQLDRLIRILSREKEVLGRQRGPEFGMQLESIQHSILLDIPYFGTERSKVITTGIHLFFRQAGAMPQRRWFVPRCSTCGRLLLTDESAAKKSSVVTGDFVSIECPHCKAKSDVSLKDLFIWSRTEGPNGREYVVWTDRGSLAEVPDTAAFPPEAHVDEGTRTVSFEWNPGAVGDAKCRFLSLRFEFPVRSASILDDAMYRGFLGLGANKAGVIGLPFRWGWLDAALEPELVKAERDGIGVRFRNLGFQGLPFRFTRNYNTTYREEPASGIAMFPGPEIHSEWKLHRIFLTSESARDLRLRTEGQPLTPDDSAMECDSWPRRFAVETGDGRYGASFFLPPLPAAASSVPAIYVGLDFGTTSTVIFFGFKGGSFSTEENGLRPAELREAIHWIARPERFPENAWWLPLVPRHGQDPCLIPSAIWVWKPMGSGRQCFAIRWHDTPPCAQAHQEGGFKWDDIFGNRDELRIRFLRELLFWSIPLMLRRKNALDSSANIKACLTFPLAFTDQQRRKMRFQQSELEKLVQAEFGHAIEFSNIDESRAAVRSLGSFNPGQHLLTADLGGRTLDLALFRVYELDKPPAIIQAGSVDLGGELFVDKLARGNEERAWIIRDQIRSGQAAEQGMPSGHRIVLDRIQLLALEMIRTMVAALRRDGNDAEVSIYLLGNGWRLRDLFAGPEGPVRYLQSWADMRLKNMQLDHCEIGIPDLDELHITHSKHIVANGALRYVSAAAQSVNEQSLSLLPAGRRIEIIEGGVIEWYQLVGDGGGPLNIDKIHSRGFHVVPECPELRETWEREISYFLLNLPSEAQLRDWILDHIVSDTNRLLKGPLQLLIERHWKGLI